MFEIYARKLRNGSITLEQVPIKYRDKLEKVIETKKEIKSKAYKTRRSDRDWDYLKDFGNGYVKQEKEQ